MANQDAPFGLRPIRSLNGSDYRNAEITVCALASYATDLFVGDAVKIAGASNSTTFNGNHKPGTLQSVEQCAAGENIDYIITGFRPDFENEDLTTTFGAASTDRTIQVVPVIATVFEIQASGATVAADAGSVADIIVGAGSTVTGISGIELDSTTTVTGLSAQLRILGVGKAVGNELGTNSVLEVLVNESNLAFGSVGV